MFNPQAHIKVRQYPVYQQGTVLAKFIDGNDWQSQELVMMLLFQMVTSLIYLGIDGVI